MNIKNNIHFLVFFFLIFAHCIFLHMNKQHLIWSSLKILFISVIYKEVLIKNYEIFYHVLLNFHINLIIDKFGYIYFLNLYFLKYFDYYFIYKKMNNNLIGIFWNKMMLIFDQFDFFLTTYFLVITWLVFFLKKLSNNSYNRAFYKSM